MPALFEIKSTLLPLIALQLRSHDWKAVAAEVLQKFGANSENSDFFDRDAVILDLSLLDEKTDSANSTNLLDWEPLLQALRACKLVPVAIKGGSEEIQLAAAQHGLVEVPVDWNANSANSANSANPSNPTLNPPPTTMRNAMIVDKPVRSGQKIYAHNSDLVLLAMVNSGAEVMADGSIHVYAPLRGKALAGIKGNTGARIFSLHLEPELISIAGIYRTSEHPLPAGIQGKPAQVYLSQDGQERMIFEALNK